MPRPKACPLTAVTDELLAMRWDNENAVRMYLRRRGTTLAKLGLIVRPADEGVCVRPSGMKPAPDPATDEVFEGFADRVDELLLEAQEDSVEDDRVRKALADNLTPEQTVEQIIAERVQALEQATLPQVVKETNAARQDGVHKDSLPVVSYSELASVLSSAEPFGVLLRGPGWTREQAELWAGQAAKLLHIDALVVNVDGTIVREIKGRAAKPPRVQRR